MKSCLLSLAVVLACITWTFGCSCERVDPQALYCKSTVAIIAKVTNIAYADGIPGVTAKQLYDVDVTHVYKGEVSEDSFKVYSEGPESVCGADLEVNSVYLLNGNVTGGALLLRYCDLMSKFPLNDPDWVFPLDTYYDCRCTASRYRFNERKPENSCDYNERYRCPPGSGALGDLAECRYSDQTGDCGWQC